MRSKFAQIALTAFVAFATLAPSAARAEEQFDVSTLGGKVVVKTKGDWHINKEYPWKLVLKGDKKVEGFSLAEKEASLANAPKGEATLKGAVCSGATCLPFKKDITIQ